MAGHPGDRMQFHSGQERDAHIFRGLIETSKNCRFFQAKVDHRLEVHNAKKEFKTNVPVVYLHFGQEGVDVRHCGVEHIRGQVVPDLGGES